LKDLGKTVNEKHEAAVSETEIRIQLVRLARKYGGANLIYGAANALLEDGHLPEDFGVYVKAVEPIVQALKTTFAMASRAGGRRRLAELLANGELELWTETACSLDQAPRPLTGPVDIAHCTLDVPDRRIQHAVFSHLVAFAEFDTLVEALEFVKAHGLELDHTCGCST
jgi:hypothetical protein